MRRLSLAVVLLCFASLAVAQTPVAPISSIALNQYGQPIPYAQITVCSVTSTGIPCTPVASIYQDYALTIPLANPFEADQFGNYLAYVPALAFPNLYVIQISAGQGLYWTYVENGPQTGGGGSGCTSTGSEYDILYGDGSGGCVGDTVFSDLSPILGPLTFTGAGISAETADDGTFTAPEYDFSITENGTSSDPCPACFTVIADDNVQGGGNILLNAYGAYGGAVQVLANSPSQEDEISNGGAGRVST